MKCDHGRLQAYLDDALSPVERTALEEHLAGCPACQEALAMLRRQGKELARHMATMDPRPQEYSDVRRALARFWVRTAAAQATKQTPFRRHWRWAAAALAALALVAGLLSIAPVRQAAAQFLGIFRVRQFTVIPVEAARMERFEAVVTELSDVLNEATVLREPGPAWEVADAGAASALAGFAVRTPAYLPGDAVLSPLTVQSGPAVRVTVERERALMLLEAAGVGDVALPEVETLSLTADLGPVVVQEYRVDGGNVLVLQTPSPSVTIPAGIDPNQVGQALLQFLGMPPDDARRLAQEIDWTSTLVIPLPTDLFRFREVRVAGATGLLLESMATDSAEPDSVVLWQAGGIVYAVAGSNVSPEVLLQVADSLR